MADKKTIQIGLELTEKGIEEIKKKVADLEKALENVNKASEKAAKATPGSAEYAQANRQLGGFKANANRLTNELTNLYTSAHKSVQKGLEGMLPEAIKTRASLQRKLADALQEETRIRDRLKILDNAQGRQKLQSNLNKQADLNQQLGNKPAARKALNQVFDEQNLAKDKQEAIKQSRRDLQESKREQSKAVREKDREEAQLENTKSQQRKNDIRAAEKEATQAENNRTRLEQKRQKRQEDDLNNSINEAEREQKRKEMATARMEESEQKQKRKQSAGVVNEEEKKGKQADIQAARAERNKQRDAEKSFNTELAAAEKQAKQEELDKVKRVKETAKQLRAEQEAAYKDQQAANKIVADIPLQEHKAKKAEWAQQDQLDKDIASKYKARTDMAKREVDQQKRLANSTGNVYAKLNEDVKNLEAARERAVNDPVFQKVLAGRQAEQMRKAQQIEMEQGNYAAAQLTNKNATALEKQYGLKPNLGAFAFYGAGMALAQLGGLTAPLTQNYNSAYQQQQQFSPTDKQSQDTLRRLNASRAKVGGEVAGFNRFMQEVETNFNNSGLAGFVSTGGQVVGKGFEILGSVLQTYALMTTSGKSIGGTLKSIGGAIGGGIKDFGRGVGSAWSSKAAIEEGAVLIKGAKAAKGAGGVASAVGGAAEAFGVGGLLLNAPKAAGAAGAAGAGGAALGAMGAIGSVAGTVAIPLLAALAGGTILNGAMGKAGGYNPFAIATGFLNPRQAGREQVAPGEVAQYKDLRTEAERNKFKQDVSNSIQLGEALKKLNTQGGILAEAAKTGATPAQIKAKRDKLEEQYIASIEQRTGRKLTNDERDQIKGWKGGAEQIQGQLEEVLKRVGGDDTETKKKIKDYAQTEPGKLVTTQLALQQNRFKEEQAMQARELNLGYARAQQDIGISRLREEQDYTVTRKNFAIQRERNEQDHQIALTKIAIDESKTRRDYAKSSYRLTFDTALKEQYVQEDYNKNTLRRTIDFNKNMGRLNEDYARNMGRLTDDTVRETKRLREDTSVATSYNAQDTAIARRNVGIQSSRSMQDLNYNLQDNLISIMAPGLADNPMFKLSQVMRDYNKEKGRISQDASLQYQQIDIESARKAYDINKQYTRGNEDIGRNYSRTAEDLGRDYARQSADLSTDYNRGNADAATEKARADLQNALELTRGQVDLLTGLNDAMLQIGLQRNEVDLAYVRNKQDLTIQETAAALAHTRNLEDLALQTKRTAEDYAINNEKMTIAARQFSEDMALNLRNLQLSIEENVQGVHISIKGFQEALGVTEQQLAADLNNFRASIAAQSSGGGKPAADGEEFVPKDNKEYRLHYGEMVLPADTAQEYREAGGTISSIPQMTEEEKRAWDKANGSDELKAAIAREEANKGKTQDDYQAEKNASVQADINAIIENYKRNNNVPPGAKVEYLSPRMGFGTGPGAIVVTMPDANNGASGSGGSGGSNLDTSLEAAKAREADLLAKYNAAKGKDIANAPASAPSGGGSSVYNPGGAGAPLIHMLPGGLGGASGPGFHTNGSVAGFAAMSAPIGGVPNMGGGQSGGPGSPSNGGQIGRGPGQLNTPYYIPANGEWGGGQQPANPRAPFKMWDAVSKRMRWYGGGGLTTPPTSGYNNNNQYLMPPADGASGGGNKSVSTLNFDFRGAGLNEQAKAEITRIANETNRQITGLLESLG